jgi:hypothetical protein
MWTLKLIICITWDILDFTVCRILFVLPFSNEIATMILCSLMFGKSGLFAGLEALDPTEQIDGFIPIATIIALANKPE